MQVEITGYSRSRGPGRETCEVEVRLDGHTGKARVDRQTWDEAVAMYEANETDQVVLNHWLAATLIKLLTNHSPGKDVNNVR